MRFLVTGEHKVWYEIEVEADSPDRALVLAKKRILMDSSPREMISFYSNEPGEYELEVTEA